MLDKLLEKIRRGVQAVTPEDIGCCVRAYGSKDKAKERLAAEGYTYVGWGRWLSMNGVVTARIERGADRLHRIDFKH
jgi:hypothetical protein